MADVVDQNDVFGDTDEQVPSRIPPFNPMVFVRNVGILMTVVAMVLVLLFYATSREKQFVDANSRVETLRDQLDQARSQVRIEPIGLTDSGTNSVPTESSQASKLRIMEEIALSAVALNEFEEMLEKLEVNERTMRDLQKRSGDWVADLLSPENNLGRKIATEEKLVEKFVYLESEIEKHGEPIAGISTFVEKMRANIIEARLAPESRYRTADEIKSQLAEFMAQVKSRTDAMSLVAAGLQSLMSRAETLSTGSEDLKHAVANFRSRQAEIRVAESQTIIKEAEKKARKERDAKIAEMRTELIASEGAVKVAELEKQKLLNVELAEKTDRDREALIENQRQAEAAKRLEAEYIAAKPEILRYLAPFIANGKRLRGNNTGDGPVSYSMVLTKALDQNDRGLTELLRLGGDQDDEFHRGANDRPRGGFPRFGGLSLAHDRYVPVDYLEKAQALLRKYGPLMVKDKLLAE